MLRLWVALLVVVPSVVRGASPVVAVFDVEDRNETLRSEERDQLSLYLRGKVAEGGNYKVVPSSALKSRLKDQKQRSYRACYDQSCQIAIGRQLAAQKSLATQILAVGSRCVLMTTLYDLRTEASESSASVQTKCDPSELFVGIDGVVARLQAATKPARVPLAKAPLMERQRTTAISIRHSEADKPRSWMSTWKWVTGVAAFAGIGAGIVYAARTASRARELEALIAKGNPSLSQPTEAYSGEMSRLEDDREAYQRNSIAMFVVGGVMAVGSTVLFGLDRKRRTTVQPVVGSHTVGLSGQVRF